MGDVFLENSQIDDILKRLAIRSILSIITFIFCFVFGLLFLFVSLSLYRESELNVFLIIILYSVIVFAGIYVYYFIGFTSRRLISYYKIIKPLHFDQISVNSKFIMSKENQIYIMFSGFANGVFFIKLEKNEDSSSSAKKSKKLPLFIFRLNKKIQKDNINIRYRELSGFFKIPLNNLDYIIGNAIILFMPLELVSKTQSKTENVLKMIEIVQEKSF